MMRRPAAACRSRLSSSQSPWVLPSAASSSTRPDGGAPLPSPLPRLAPRRSSQSSPGAQRSNSTTSHRRIQMSNSDIETNAPQAGMSRRGLLQAAGAGALAVSALAIAGLPAAAQEGTTMTTDWDKVFPKSGTVDHRKVTFKNRYGITLAGDLYLPQDGSSEGLPAIIVGGPFGAVKEQSSGLYAQTMAERGFITLAFDPSFTGESGGEPRNIASPDINTEDFSAAVDFLGLQPSVDRERIGVIGVCGFGGMGLSAAAVDKRIKAVAVSTMYDMSRVISKGYNDTVTLEQRTKTLEELSRQRWQDAEKGTPAYG